MNKSERHIITVEQGAVSPEEYCQRACGIQARERAAYDFYSSDGAVFVAAVALWMVSHWWFGVIFTDSHPASDSRTFYVMNMWNVLMYFMPGMFAALSAGCLAVALVFESLGLFSLYTTLLWQKCCIYRQSRQRREGV